LPIVASRHDLSRQCRAAAWTLTRRSRAEFFTAVGGLVSYGTDEPAGGCRPFLPTRRFRPPVRNRNRKQVISAALIIDLDQKPPFEKRMFPLASNFRGRFEGDRSLPVFPDKQTISEPAGLRVRAICRLMHCSKQLRAGAEEPRT